MYSTAFDLTPRSWCSPPWPLVCGICFPRAFPFSKPGEPNQANLLFRSAQRRKNSDRLRELCRSPTYASTRESFCHRRPLLLARQSPEQKCTEHDKKNVRKPDKQLGVHV